MATIKILGLANGEPTPFDNQFIVEYDPAREGLDPNGNPMFCHLVCTPDQAKAKQLTVTEALELWNSEHGLRSDGAKSRPLTAFSVEIS